MEKNTNKEKKVYGEFFAKQFADNKEKIKQHSYEFVSIEEGEELFGTILGIKVIKNEPVLLISIGEKEVLFGGAVLASIAEDLVVGDLIHIKHNGKKKSRSSNFTYNDYKITTIPATQQSKF